MATVFNNLLRRQVAGRLPTVEYIQRNTDILDNLVKAYVVSHHTRVHVMKTHHVIISYESPDIALTCGGMLRECIKHETLAKVILYSPRFWDFFKYVEVANFDIASDAFSSFKVWAFRMW